MKRKWSIIRTEWLRKILPAIDLREQLLLLALFPVVVFALTWGGYVIYQRASDLRSQLLARGELLGRQMSIAADYGMFAQNLAALESLSAGVAGEPGVQVALLLDVRANVLVRRGRNGTLESNLWPEFEQQVKASIERGQYSAVFDHGSDLAFLHPVRTPDLAIEDFSAQTATAQPTIQGYGVVVITTRDIRAELLRFVLVVVTFLIAILIGVGKIAIRFSTRIHRHLQALEEAALRIGSGSSEVHLPQSGVPAFDRLSAHINAMARQLEQSRRLLEQRVLQATHAVREQRDAAEQANQAKTRFLAAASHDLRQPMHALSMILAALGQEQQAAARADLLSRAEAAAHVMSDLLNALLDISRLDSGGVNPHPETFALGPMLERLRDTYDSLAGRKQVVMTVRPSNDTWTTSDPSMLERIVGNFISNAIRYTPPGGQVLVAVRQRADSFLIQVRDNGPGIDRDSQRLIFQEFVQLHNPQRNRSEGLGLGLAIVQRLARLLFHPISVRSCPGYGSTFAISVPRSAPLGLPQSAALDRDDNVMNALKGCKVLLIEDDALVRASYQQLLALWGCEIKAHPDGTSALAYCRNEHWQPHVILTDYRLEAALDGLELVHALRDLYATMIPAVIVTGDTEDLHLYNLQYAQTKVLFKPVRPIKLAQTIKELGAPGVIAEPRK